MPNMKMIIDCDTGVDDALAISWILSNPAIDFLGVTTTFGNVSVDTAVKNTLNLLEMFNRSDVGVYRGAEHAWGKDCYERSPRLDHIHGKNGIGDVELGEPSGKARDTSAVDFILESARKYGKDLHMVFVGPLVNFAECLKKDPEAMQMIGNITIMGGALTIQGNRNVFAEANIADDPVAANYCFESGVHINVVPLDATLRTLFSVADIHEWEGLNQAGKNLFEIAKFYYVNEYRSEDVGGAMHDPLAAYASFDPSIITNWYDCNITVEKDNGRMIGTFAQWNLPEKRHRVALDVDAKRFMEEYIRDVTALIAKQ